MNPLLIDQKPQFSAAEITKNFSHLRCSAASGEPAASHQTSLEPAGDGTMVVYNYGL